MNNILGQQHIRVQIKIKIGMKNVMEKMDTKNI